MSRALLKQVALPAGLSLLMAVTRFGHFGTAWSPPDASWAIFFLGGFYLGRHWRWLLPLWLLEAAALDFAAIQYAGVDNYCVTVAYWFIAPAYSALWAGGMWMRRHYRGDSRDWLPLASSLLLSASTCYLLTNGSFYWLGGRVSDPTLAGWWKNLNDWYLHYLTMAFEYVAIAAALHILGMRQSQRPAWTSGPV